MNDSSKGKESQGNWPITIINSVQNSNDCNWQKSQKKFNDTPNLLPWNLPFLLKSFFKIDTITPHELYQKIDSFSAIDLYLMA